MGLVSSAGLWGLYCSTAIPHNELQRFKTPTLSSPGVSLAADAYQIMTILRLYLPSSMLSGAGNHVLDLATINKSGTFSIITKMSTIGCTHI